MFDKTYIESADYACRFCGTPAALLEISSSKYRYICRACKLEGPWENTVQDALKAYAAACKYHCSGLKTP